MDAFGEFHGASNDFNSSAGGNTPEPTASWIGNRQSRNPWSNNSSGFNPNRDPGFWGDNRINPGLEFDPRFDNSRSGFNPNRDPGFSGDNRINPGREFDPRFDNAWSGPCPQPEPRNLLPDNNIFPPRPRSLWNGPYPNPFGP